jgi:hypothetical protein
MLRRPSWVWCVLSLGTLPARSVAQDGVLANHVKMEITGRLQIQYNTTSVDSAAGEALPWSEFVLRRARLTFDITFNDLLSARMEPDYSTTAGVGLVSVRDAYIRFHFGSGVRATLGQFKRPFDLFQLTSSTEFPVVERGGRVRGVTACGALLTVCSFSNLSVGLLYSDRDLGLMLDGAAIPHTLTYALSLTNGELQRVPESSSGKQLTGRVSLIAIHGATISANGSFIDYRHPLTQATRHALGWGADADLGNPARGPRLLVGLIGGDNWRTARLTPGDTTDVVSFLTAQAMASYRTPLRDRWIKGVEPVVRASWADPNRTLADDGGWLLTPGVILHFDGRNRLYVNADVWLPNAGTTEYALLTQMNFTF